MNFDRTVRLTRIVKRSIRWIERPTIATEGWGCVEIHQDKKCDLYLIKQIPADFGIGYTLEKLSAQFEVVEQYDINLAGDRDSTCTCRGFTQHNHCKHVAGLLALERQGELPHCHWPRRTT